MKTLKEIEKAAKAAGLGEVSANLVPYGKNQDGDETQCLQLMIVIPDALPREEDAVVKALGCVQTDLVIMAHRVPLYPRDQVRILLNTDALPVEVDSAATAAKHPGRNAKSEPPTS